MIGSIFLMALKSTELSISSCTLSRCNTLGINLPGIAAVLEGGDLITILIIHMYFYTAQIEKQLQGNLELTVRLAVYKTAGLLA